MKKTLITLYLSMVASISFSQVNNNCAFYNFGGGFSSLTASWQSVTNQNSFTSYLHTGATCPVQVGIGTNIPRSALDVFGRIYSDGLAIGVNPQNMVGKFHIVTGVTSNTPLNLLRIENGDRQLMNLDNTGLLRTREIIVDAEIWPDYVFDKDYKLMPLTEVEEYIEENGHLPNVPSEEEVTREGQSLGEMNKILLEKVEELTLHMIEQQKQIVELQEQIKK